MGDRAYAPASKPVPVAAPRSANGTANGGGVGPPRPPPMVPGRVPPPPMYRPKPMQQPPRRRRSGRGWCCACCLWLTLVLVGLVFLGAIALGVFYVIYHGASDLRRDVAPSGGAERLGLRLRHLRIEFTVTARNPNEKIAFVYGDIGAAFAADGTDIRDGTVPGFVHQVATTVIKGAASAAAATVDPVQAASLRSKKSHAMSVEMDSKVGFQIGKFKSKRINVRVLCSGFSAGLAKPAPSPAPIIVAAAPAPTRSKIRLSSSSSGGGGAATTDAKCKLRVKIWIWTF
ncbi:hypothetical protein ZWY2020_010988 [Hordeum vulgare]|nr:hypothetical protein ZWY2020_010988 [Hordeum vulgare]